MMKFFWRYLRLIIGVAAFLAVALALHGWSRHRQNRPGREEGLDASMSDEQILRTFGHDPASLAPARQDLPDGYLIIYSNDTTEVQITRTRGYGVNVVRQKPEQQSKIWVLGNP